MLISAAVLATVVLVSTPSANAQSNTARTWTLTQENAGLAVFPKCTLRVAVFQQQASIEIGCAHLKSSPPLADLHARRELSRRELDAFIELSNGSDLYGGGHTGKVGPPYGSGSRLETLTVFCCDRNEVVVLVTTGNPTFEKDGPRRRLLGQLDAWCAELKTVAEQRARASAK
jgi:hypothetical protein